MMGGCDSKPKGPEGVPGNTLVFVALVALLVMPWVCYHFLMRFADQRYQNIEV